MPDQAKSNQAREEALFEAARQLRPAERGAFLDQACAGEPAMRAQLEVLLAAETEAEKFFKGSTPELRLRLREGDDAALEAGEFTAELLSSNIGPYKLLQKIGEGGCGVVYMAEQEQPVRRRVALKVIKLGMDTKSVIARFEAERQALAMMEHPSIARVLDAGATEAGRPYFVMELVRGVKITEYCDQNNLATRHRLELFCRICQAIQHAHQKGIIHRDIKPSNILVTLHDGVPVPKVIDFGIAKAIEQRLTDKTLFTAYEQIIGTPAYMSPEQAERSGLDVDTRSDIYSLGVLLYELLTGRTPFDSKELMKSGMEEMRRTLREREPARPSQRLNTLQGDELTATAMHRHVEPPKLVSQMRGDLDWIVMKSLEKDRTRRYETANGLGMDIQRHLNNEPVVARPPTRRYRFQKLVRRNRGVFVATGAVMVALLAGLGTSTWLFLREREARQRAVAAERGQARLRTEAERATALEAEMRRQAEAREKITQAAVKMDAHQLDEVNRLLAEIPPTQTAPGGAVLFRAAGEWNALRGDWRAAADRFTMLLRIGKVEMWEDATLDGTRTAAALIEAKDEEGFERYQREALARFAGTTDAVVAERTIKNCLLRPGSPELVEQLVPLAEIAAKSLAATNAVMTEESWQIPWRCLSLTLFEYRRGNYSAAVDWGQRCLGYGSENPARSASAHALLAMAESRLNQIDEARTELELSRAMMDEKMRTGLDAGNGTQGHWFDWVVGRILLREAVTTMGETPHSLMRNPSE